MSNVTVKTCFSDMSGMSSVKICVFFPPDTSGTSSVKICTVCCFLGVGGVLLILF